MASIKRLAVTVITACAALTAACSSTVDGTAAPDPNVATAPSAEATTSGPATSPVTSPTTSPAAGPLGRLAGVWSGSYLCNQGETALTLTIAAPGAGASRFDFHATAGNPGVPTGAFTQAVGFDGADLVFTPIAWVNQPDGYMMVSLRVPGPVDPSTDVLKGTVKAVGCTTFEVRRTAAH